MNTSIEDDTKESNSHSNCSYVSKSYLHTDIYLGIVLQSFKDYKFACISIQTLTDKLNRLILRTAKFENQGLILRSCLNWTKISNYECMEVFFKSTIKHKRSHCSFADLLDVS